MKVYGLDEIAEKVGKDRPTIERWFSQGMIPPPSEMLATGPVWLPQAIEPRLQHAPRK